jgi:hypothetical protein
MHTRQKLGNPLFIIAVLVMLINDWYLKQTYPGFISGKLSDFTGLFAFPFFIAALFPGRTGWVYIITFILFLYWKSPLAQPFIDGLQILGIPLNRVVDYSDYIALSILPLSYYTFKVSPLYRAIPALLNMLIFFSALSFLADSYGRPVTFTNINKTYTFNCSKRELVSRINSMQLEYIHKLQYLWQGRNKPNGGNIKADGPQFDFESKTNIFVYTTSTGERDTIAQLFDYKKVKDQDTIKLDTHYTSIIISGNDTTSQVTLLGMRAFLPTATNKQKDKNRAIGYFEHYFIKKIKSYSK